MKFIFITKRTFTLQINDELYSLIIIHKKKKKKKKSNLHITLCKYIYIFFFKISKIEMISQTIIFVFSILKIILKSGCQTHKL